MKMYSILSDTISHIEYDEHTLSLSIFFNDGSEGVYHEVPKFKIELFIDSINPDSFYSANFKNRYHEIILS